MLFDIFFKRCVFSDSHSKHFSSSDGSVTSHSHDHTRQLNVSAAIAYTIGDICVSFFVLIVSILIHLVSTTFCSLVTSCDQQ